jgi:succinate dehydrogenase/fumarate reductase cytochrome b subunit
MIPKKIHYWSGILITVFVVFHLLNHAVSLFGADSHIAWMNSFRIVYRHPIVEILLLLAVLVQIISGIQLFRRTRDTAKGFWAKLQRWSGGYLAMFFLIHLSAVLGGRYVLNLDTNFYFGVAGLNTFPFLLFFVPYYGLAIIAFFAHIASIHFHKMKKSIFSITVSQQSKGILIFGVCLTMLILYGLTNGFGGVAIPAEYNVLIGK